MPAVQAGQAPATGQIWAQVLVRLPAEDRRHCLPAVAGLAGDGCDAAGGQQDAPHLGCVQGRSVGPVLVAAPTGRLTIKQGPAVAAALAMQPPAPGAIAAAPALTHRPDAAAL